MGIKKSIIAVITVAALVFTLAAFAETPSPAPLPSRLEPGAEITQIPKPQVFEAIQEAPAVEPEQTLPPAVMHKGSPSGMIAVDDGKTLLVTDMFSKTIWELNTQVVLEGNETGGVWFFNLVRLDEDGQPLPQASQAPVTQDAAESAANLQEVGDAVRIEGQGLDAGDFDIYAGVVTEADEAGEALGGYKDGGYNEAEFQSPWDIAPFMDGYIVTDSEVNVLRYLDGENVSTLAGRANEAGYADGAAGEALFSNPTGLAADDEGNVYIADTGNHCIRMLAPDGEVSTFAGLGEGRADGDLATAAFREPTGLYWSGGSLYVADSGNHRVVKISGGKATTLAGIEYEDGSEAFLSGGYADGDALQAEFSYPQGVYESEGVVYIADAGNNAVRRLKDGAVDTLMKADPQLGGMHPVSPRSMLQIDKILYISDYFAGIVFTYDLESGVMSGENIQALTQVG